MSALGHIPVRPTWHCIRCHVPWPCADKRAQLLAAHEDEAPISLRLLMSLRLSDAASDLGGMTAAQLWQRFLAWVPGVPTGPPSAVQEAVLDDSLGWMNR